MAINVQGPADLGAWADSKSCEPWKADRSCGHAACVQAQRAVDILSALVEVEPGVWQLVEEHVHLTA
jgi:hypothetical protein